MLVKPNNKEAMIYSITGFVVIILYLLISLSFANFNNEVLSYIYKYYNIVEFSVVAIITVFCVNKFNSKPSIKTDLLLSISYFSYVLLEILLFIALCVIAVISIIGIFFLTAYFTNSDFIRVFFCDLALRFIYVFATITITRNITWYSKNLSAFKNNIKEIYKVLAFIVIIPILIFIYNPSYMLLNGIITDSIFYVGTNYNRGTQQRTLNNGDIITLLPNENSFEIYDIRLNKKTIVDSPIHIPTNWERVLVLPNNKLLFYGGITFHYGSGSRKTVDKNSYIFDPLKKTFKRIGDVKLLFSRPDILMLPNNRVLFMQHRYKQEISDVQLFDEATNKFTIKNIVFPVYSPKSINLGNNKVLIYGYQATGKHNTKIKTQLYNLTTDTFEQTGNQPTSSNLSSSILLKNGNLLIIGTKSIDNFNRGEAIQTIEIYNPNQNKFIKLNLKLNIPRKDADLTLLKDGNVLISGGQSISNNTSRGMSYFIKESEIFNPQTLQISNIANRKERLNDDYYAGAKYILPNGNILYFGGSEGRPPAVNTLKSIEMFDNKSSTYKIIGNMRCARENLTIIPVDKNKIMIYGNAAGKLSNEILDIRQFK